MKECSVSYSWQKLTGIIIHLHAIQNNQLQTEFSFEN